MIKKLYKKLISEKTRNSIREFAQEIISPIYYGENFYCSCCNKKNRKFLVKGNIPRLNAQCPYCFSLERTRVLDLYIHQEIDIYHLENISILHFAPENALFKKLSRIKNSTYIDADINPAYARYVIDITKITFPDNYFDYIICSHVLGHVPNEALAISEMYRVLKFNGIALVLTLLSNKSETLEDKNIITPEDKLKVYGEPDLCRLHGNDFAEKLSNAGFKVEIIDYRLSFSHEIQQKYSLGNGEREVIFKCTKTSVA